MVELRPARQRIVGLAIGARERALTGGRHVERRSEPEDVGGGTNWAQSDRVALLRGHVGVGADRERSSARAAAKGMATLRSISRGGALMIMFDGLTSR